MGDATTTGFGLVSTPTNDVECRKEEAMNAEDVWGDELAWRLQKEEEQQSLRDAMKDEPKSAVDTARAE